MTTQSLYDDTVTSQEMFDTTTDLPMASKDIDAAALIEVIEEFIPEPGLDTQDGEEYIDEETDESEFEYVEEETAGNILYEGESTQVYQKNLKTFQFKN